jgi:two-component system, NtrC family, sensor kinase
VREKIFDPFFTTKPVGKGTGLGMSISHEIIVEKHRGSLSCTAADTEGTCFTITIPIDQPELD